MGSEQKTRKKVFLGNSQKAVLIHIKTHGPLTSQQIGDGVYAAVSSCAKSVEGTHGSKAVRRTWAQRILNSLEIKGLLKFRYSKQINHGRLNKIWYLSDPSECPECKALLIQDCEYPDDLICGQCKKVFDRETLKFVEKF